MEDALHMQVFIHDPLYRMGLSATTANHQQLGSLSALTLEAADGHEAGPAAAPLANADAERTVLRCRQKLQGRDQGAPVLAHWTLTLSKAGSSVSDTVVFSAVPAARCKLGIGCDFLHQGCAAAFSSMLSDIHDSHYMLLPACFCGYITASDAS